MGGRLAIDETNNVYGKLKVLYRDTEKIHKSHAYWICKNMSYEEWNTWLNRISEYRKGLS